MLSLILLFASISIIGTVLFTTRYSKKPIFFIQFNQKVTFKILFTVTALLVLATILSEFAISRAPAVALPPIADPQLEEKNFELEEKIMNGERVDESLLYEKRIHDAKDSLILQQFDDSFIVSAHFFIERKKEDDSTIEERIYKPFFIVDQYDFTDVVSTQLPIWEDNIVSFSSVPTTKKIRYTSFTEASTLDQFAKTATKNVQIDGWSTSMSSGLIIHLIVPEDVDIIADDNVYVSYVGEDEW